MPYGKGGVSVPLARKYGVTVVGCDIVEAYVYEATEFARTQGVSHLCDFEVEDLRCSAPKN